MELNSRKSAAQLLAERGKAKVTPRTDDLNELVHLSQSDITSSEDNQTLQRENGQLKNETNNPLDDFKQELSQMPVISNFMLRIEQNIKEEIQSHSKKNGITPETLFQAMWVVLKADSKQLEKITLEAKDHHKRRTRAAELKHLVTRALKALE